ncbi:triose-phosphate isomerase [Candidatus Sumerlaeota bacterium]|nr:triose-phosphate isomerase [Candidatus Sumerlaeota bacterium]
MRRYILAGNWKMHLDAQASADLVKALIPSVKDSTDVDVVVGPVFTSIPAVVEAAQGTNIAVAAQNCYWEDSGAFTGEIAVPMLKAAGCAYCIVGHSERRQFFGETDEKINKKAQALYKHGLTPIVCCGELLEEREAGKTTQVVETQLRGCLKDLPADKVRTTVLAYEPVWAIGTGKVATPAQAQEVHATIRALLVELYGQDVADAVRIQYGGSVKADNVKELMGQTDIDGALVGGAALKPDSFAAIVNFQK